jgi:hypothetical protein
MVGALGRGLSLSALPFSHRYGLCEGILQRINLCFQRRNQLACCLGLLAPLIARDFALAYGLLQRCNLGIGLAPKIGFGSDFR